MELWRSARPPMVDDYPCKELALIALYTRARARPAPTGLVGAAAAADGGDFVLAEWCWRIRGDDGALAIGATADGRRLSMQGISFNCTLHARASDTRTDQAGRRGGCCCRRRFRFSGMVLADS